MPYTTKYIRANGKGFQFLRISCNGLICGHLFSFLGFLKKTLAFRHGLWQSTLGEIIFGTQRMDSRIKNLKSTTFCGTRLTRRQLVGMQQTVERFPALSRQELAAPMQLPNPQIPPKPVMGPRFAGYYYLPDTISGFNNSY